MDDSFVIAIEQYLYWRKLGLSDQQMLDAIGYYRTDARLLGTCEVIDKIALAWRGLRREHVLWSAI